MTYYTLLHLTSFCSPLPSLPIPHFPLYYVSPQPPSTFSSPFRSAGANEVLIQNFRNQVEEFKMKGRYQETQQNLAIFAVKERYVKCHNLYDCFCNIPFTH